MTQLSTSYSSGATNAAPPPTDEYFSAGFDGEWSDAAHEAWLHLNAESDVQRWQSYVAIGESLRAINASCPVSDSGDFMAQFRSRFAEEKPLSVHSDALWSHSGVTRTKMAVKINSNVGASVSNRQTTQPIHHNTDAANDTRFWKRAAGFASVAAVAAMASVVWMGTPSTGEVVAQGNLQRNMENVTVADASTRSVPMAAARDQGQWQSDPQLQRYLRTHRQFAGNPYWSQRPNGLQQASYQPGN